MNTTQLGNVAIKNSGFSRSKFPMSGNIYTSCGFGEVSPVACVQTEADSESRIDTETLCYLASINAPTYGHVSLDFWHYFVNFTDLIEDVYPQLMSQTAGQGIDAMFAPDKVPNLPRNVISILPLFYSHCTIYMRTIEVNGTSRYYTPICNSTVDGSQAATNGFLSLLQTHLRANVPTDVDPINALDNSLLGYKNISLDLRLLVDVPELEDYASPIYIPLSNPCGAVTEGESSSVDWGNNLFEIQDENGATINRDWRYGVDIAPVSIDGADFIIERKIDGFVYAFAFRMHSFGSRLYKILKGCRFGFDFTDKSPQSLLPLFAVYKAYYSCFGLTLYENWNYTPAGRLLKLFVNANGGGDSPYFINYFKDLTVDLNVNDLFGSFIRELGSCWYTASQDFISSLQSAPVVGPAPTQSLVDSVGPHAGFTPGTQQSSIVQPSSATGVQTVVEDSNSHAYINRVIHNHLDSETLKTLYLITNRNSIAGKRIEELLRTQGLGKWVDSAKPRFIGHSTIPVDFTQEISTANTFNSATGEGAIVGERGGRGQAYGESKNFYYTNDEAGFLISLVAVIPDAGYLQSHNVAFDCIKKEDFYLADFDGKGQELLPIKMVCGDVPVSLLEGDEELENATLASFGWSPRSAKFKVNFNVLSGNFSRRSKRKSKLTYCTDKFIGLGETVQSYSVEQNDGVSEYPDLKHRLIEATAIFPVSEFPRAGLVWRYPTRYAWLGNFNRIFANLGDAEERYHTPLSVDSMFKSYEWVNNEEDGFDVMSTFKLTQRKHMLPITDSYETREDGNKGEIDTNISKA